MFWNYGPLKLTIESLQKTSKEINCNIKYPVIFLYSLDQVFVEGRWEAGYPQQMLT